MKEIIYTISKHHLVKQESTNTLVIFVYFRDELNPEIDTLPIRLTDSQVTNYFTKYYYKLK